MARYRLTLQIYDFCFVSGRVQTTITHSFSDVQNIILSWMDQSRNSLEFDFNTSSDGDSEEIGSNTHASSPPSDPSDSARALEIRCKELEQKVQENRVRSEEESKRRD